MQACGIVVVWVVAIEPTTVLAVVVMVGAVVVGYLRVEGQCH